MQQDIFKFHTIIVDPDVFIEHEHYRRQRRGYSYADIALLTMLKVLAQMHLYPSIPLSSGKSYNTDVFSVLTTYSLHYRMANVTTLKLGQCPLPLNVHEEIVNQQSDAELSIDTSSANSKKRGPEQGASPRKNRSSRRWLRNNLS
uniref:Transposase n=1 Tax=Panagrellus redivivus TaxID=6233 RepID=A0A7E4UU65_PANRE